MSRLIAEKIITEETAEKAGGRLSNNQRMSTSFMLRENDIMALKRITSQVNSKTITKTVTKSHIIRALIKLGESVSTNKIVDTVRKQI